MIVKRPFNGENMGLWMRFLSMVGKGVGDPKRRRGCGKGEKGGRGG